MADMGSSIIREWITDIPTKDGWSEGREKKEKKKIQRDEIKQD